MYYTPLPDNLTIKESPIHGLGLFATKDIPKDTEIGVTHIVGVTREPIRTPLGGFYNHSETPNCIKVYSEKQISGCVTYLLTAIEDIKAGDEITVKYTLYDPTKE
jgi:SET domain-containing protein